MIKIIAFKFSKNKQNVVFLCCKYHFLSNFIHITDRKDEYPSQIKN